MTNNLLLVLILMITSCRREIVKPQDMKPSVTDSSLIELVWKVPLAADTGDYSSVPPQLGQDGVFFSTRFYNSNGPVLNYLEKKSGSVKWNWTEYVRAADFGRYASYLIDNKLVICDKEIIYVIDVLSGTKLWSSENVLTNKGKGSPRISVINNQVYHCHMSEGLEHMDAHLVRSAINNSSWDTIYSLSAKDGYSPSFEPPSLWLNSSGDSVLIFQVRSFNFSSSDGRVDIVAYNLRSGLEYFRIKDIEPEGNSNVAPLLIFKDKAYFMGAQTLYCIDMINGKVTWKRTFASSIENLITGEMAIVKNRLIIKTAGYQMTSLELESGSTIWDKTNNGFSPSPLTYFNGIIYFLGGGVLNIVSESTGEVIVEHKATKVKNKTTGFDRACGVVIDPATGMLYTADNRFMLCFKLSNRLLTTYK